MTTIFKGLFRFLGFYYLAAALSLSACADNAAIVQSSENNPVQVKLGVVIDQVGKPSEAEKAGFHAGDVLVTWSRGTEHGVLESPFDLLRANIEQRPLGEVEIRGFRGPQPMSWRPGSVSWDMKMRPNLSAEGLRLYSQTLRLVRSSPGAFDSAAVLWSSTPSLPVWFRPWLFMEIADILDNNQHWSEGDAWFKRAIDEAGQCSADVHSQIQQLWANSYLLRSDIDEAEKHFTAALQYAEEPGTSSLSAARVYRLLGNALTQDSIRGEKHLLRALEIQRKIIPHALDTAGTLTLLARVAVRKGDLSLAEKYLLAAHNIEDRYTCQNIWCALTLNLQATVALSQGNLTQAERYTRSALEVQDLIPTPYQKASLLDTLGIIYFYRSDLESAEKYFRQELAIQPKGISSNLYTANALANLGSVLKDLGQHSESKKYIHQAMFIEKRLAGRGVIPTRAYQDLAALALAEGDIAEAEKYAVEALNTDEAQNIADVDIASTAADLARIYLERGNTAKALDYFKRAEKFPAEGLLRADILSGLAEALQSSNRLEEAEQYYSRALDALETRIALLGGSDQSRFAFRSHYSDVYQQYANLLAAKGETENAFNIVERSRSRTLLEMLSAARIDIHTGVSPELLAQERSLQADITAKTNRRIRLLAQQRSDEALKGVDGEIAALLTQYRDVQAQIRSSSPGYAALTQPQPLTAREIQNELLDSNTLLLEYSLGKEHSYVFVITTDELRVFELPSRKMIEKAARRLYGSLTARNHLVRGQTATQQHLGIKAAEKSYSAAALEVSKILLGPLASMMPGKRLAIVTDGALAYIPFSALPEPGSPGMERRQTNLPLIENHEIVNLPSASVLGVLRQQQEIRTAAPKGIVVLADPVFDEDDPRVRRQSHRTGNREARTREVSLRYATVMGVDQASDLTSNRLVTRSAADIGLKHKGQVRLSRLPFTRQEANEILMIAPGGMQALDFNASRLTAISPELGRYRIVHYATHGFLNSVNPALSGLVFSMVDNKGRARNGFVGLQDVYNLKLNADLVVLSGCETGLGQEIDGEGLVGLTQGFMYAGANRVIASLWNVSDAATAVLMANLYRAIEQERLAPAAALRKAQLQMSHNPRWNSPYYWAAFQILGEWR